MTGSAVPRCPPRPIDELDPTDVDPRFAVCTPATDRSAWNPRIVRFYDYWLSIAPAGRLPGRQHLDPLHIPDLMPRVWILDVLRDPLRFRYRLAGTKEVETLEREVTGQDFEDAHAGTAGRQRAIGRYRTIVEQRVATYRKGPTRLLRRHEHRIAENCVVPLARDGRMVDMILGCTVLYGPDGREY